MLIDIYKDGILCLSYDGEQAPAVGETITISINGIKILLVTSVDHLINIGYSGKVTLGGITVYTKEVQAAEEPSRS